MNVNTELQYAGLDNFYLDTKNPRLGRFQSNRNLSQEEVLDLMRNWVLDELAGSYLESGFWEHEALLVVEEELDGNKRLIVVEGNRRLAALIYLCRAINGNPISKKWGLLVENREVSGELFDRIPYIQVETRETIEAFRGFRHTSRIKQWYPLEKTRYIGRLIDEQNMTYKEVALKIGNYTSTVRHYYISYRLVLQIESSLEGFSFEDADSQFSVLYHSLRNGTVQEYLNIDSSADPHEAQTPVPKKRLDALAHFAGWLFGTQKQPPIFIEPWRIDDYAKILESPEAVQYLENSERPNLDYALQLSVDSESKCVQLLSEAAANVKLVMSGIHRYKGSPEIQRAVENLVVDYKELLDQSLGTKTKLLSDD